MKKKTMNGIGWVAGNLKNGEMYSGGDVGKLAKSLPKCRHKWREDYEDCSRCGGGKYYHCTKCGESRHDKNDPSTEL